jgi:ABC-type uncharacterized transport system permease subunit
MHLILHMLELLGIYLPLVIGMYLTQTILRIPDLSMETACMVGGMSSCFFIPMMNLFPSAIALPLLIVIALLTGALVGLCSSVLTVRLGIAHVFSAIITAGIGTGLIYLLMTPYQGLSGYTNHLLCMGNAYGVIPALVFINLLICVLCIYLMRAQLGYLLIAAGSNRSVFALLGISFETIFCTGVIIANAFAGLTGYLMAQTMFFADVHMGLGRLLFALVAVMIGRLFIASNRAIVLVPIIGTSIQIVMQQLLLRVGFNLNYFSLIHGVVLIVFLALFRNRLKTLFNTDI